ncbi:ABC transporter permease protein [Candidatus Puniceispirillum marinum IMCC1322]|uniref:ABC transporter permease protein n=2 Tax=Candidatus Puniceispirillum TaxID=767891 RepID=D5BMI5_PUNMI|nr:ABC transporter permease protein [Candidatus Puniceispirillum marinum IMCC1322]
MTNKNMKHDNTLEIEGVVGRFGGLAAVDNVSMCIRRGERRAVLGPNGAGKTTLFNLLAGIHPVAEGSVFLNQCDITKMAPNRRVDLGLRRTYQNAKLFDGLTVRENLLISQWGATNGWTSCLPFAQLSQSPITEIIENVAEQVGLTDALSETAGALSHGKRRQLEIGMALAGEPIMLLLDEPAAGLSPAERVLLSNLLGMLAREITLIIIEHDVDLALQYADWVSVMHNGKIIADGSPSDIMDNDHVRMIYMGGT